MDSWDLKKWRKKFGYNQFEAAEKLGVNRGAVQNWEREIRPVPKAVELACEELNQLATRHPGFGPVLLNYTDGPYCSLRRSPTRYQCCAASPIRPTKPPFNKHAA
ncbi:helix-turn-helix transcriptional regulator [Bradyrhizobium diazoefficiens]|nr:helix-turn-helix transcriptional regulator [Bradyrhizobium diazoefficiens]